MQIPRALVEAFLSPTSPVVYEMWASYVKLNSSAPTPLSVAMGRALRRGVI